MKITEDELVVQVENPVDFESLKHHKFYLSNYLLHQQLDGYFGMSNGPTYEGLVKYFQVRAEVYKKDVAKLEEEETIRIDPSLGLKEFTINEIHSVVIGIPITITKEIIRKATIRDVDGKFQ